MITCELTAITSPSLSKNDSGLGNVLFQVSATYGISKKFGIDYSFPKIATLCDKLEELGLDHKNTIFRKLPIKDVENCTIYNEPAKYSETYNSDMVDWVEKNINRNIMLHGYMQSHLYFDLYRDDILSMFEPDERSLELIKAKYSCLFTNEYTSISLHVRRGYGNLRNITEFYEDSMSIMNSKYTNCVFYVFSNDPEWCKHNLTANNIHIVEGNLDYIDLWLMSLCNHNIISHSTLSWWGAYLNKNENKEVIFSEDVFKIYHGGLYSVFMDINRQTEHFYKHWTCLSSKMYAK